MFYEDYDKTTSPRVYFIPNHRISPRLSGKQPKSIDCHQLDTGGSVRIFYLLEKFIVGHGETMAGHSSFKIIFHLPPLKLIAHSDNVKH